jgi:hypothetical protein
MAIGTELEYNRLRRDVGANEAVFDDTYAELLFEESTERYPDDTSKMKAYTRVLALRGIRASAAMLGKYAQNQSEEDLTKVFDNVSALLKDAEKEVDKVADAIEADTAPFFFGTARGWRGR